ncbi:MAG TPA: PDZ domain-containing protein [Vicinamibacterales bacterium]|nr:PDZ domain-containing protein [Vicinamibacterales bacterium]
MTSCVSVGLRFCRTALSALSIIVVLALVASAQQPALSTPRLEDARQAYEATNYEAAAEMLNGLIARIGAPADAAQRQELAAAFELRGRSRLNLRDVDGARADFRSMLLLDPSLMLPAQAGPRAQALFDEVRVATVGQVEISVTPADATVTLDGVRLAERPSTLTLVVGSHTIAATRPGHRAGGQSFTVLPGAAPQVISLVLERELSTLTLTTAPPNVEVVIDGVSRGATEPDLNSVPRAGVNALSVSKPMFLEDLATGRHRLEFRRDCFVTAEQSLDVTRPDDLKLDLVRLAPAVATVSISSDTAGSTIFVDDAPRGSPPEVLSDICQGAHTFEVRTANGRDVRHFDLRPGQKETFAARVRPAFAIVSDGGANQGIRGGPDLRLAAETTFQDSRTLKLFASPDKRTAEISTAEKLPPDWLAFDALRRPIGGASKVGESARRQVGLRFVKAFDVQGVAAVAREPGRDPSDMLMILLAPGSGKPDVIRWKVDNPASVRQAISLLDDVPQMTRASIGLLAIDVLDVPGPVVVSVEPGGSAAAAGIQPGDIVTGAGSTGVTGAAQLLQIVNAQPAGQPLVLEVRDRAGVAKKVQLTAQRVPRLVELADQTVLSNVLAVQLAARVRTASGPLEESAVRLNLAGALMRLASWSEASRELDAVIALAAKGTLPAPVRESISGTAHYLLGACAEASGDAAAAERAWALSAQSPSVLLTDSGGLLKELSEKRLAQLRQARGAAANAGTASPIVLDRR